MSFLKNEAKVVLSQCIGDQMHDSQDTGLSNICEAF